MKLIKYIQLLFSLFLTVTVLNSCDTKNKQGTGIITKEIKQYKFLLQPLTANDLFNINYGNKDVDEKEKKIILAEYETFCCFRFDIKVEGFDKEITEYYDKADEKVDYDQLLNYYLFGMQQDFKLLGMDGSEASCNIYFYERNFMLTKSNRFIVGFKKPSKMETLTFSYDNRFLSIGKINFQINKNDFKG
ncbi:MAG: hypothetical protein H0W73_17095 [Bacteroidetes bacterium]|nr:hypothetical protein [Bacteroidota bacterium]